MAGKKAPVSSQARGLPLPSGLGC